MPDDALGRVLRLVAEGRLTADEAGPILDALEDRGGSDRGAAATRPVSRHDQLDPAVNRDPAKTLRVEVTDGGRAVVNLRIPLSLGRAALSQVPGISDATSDRIREAINAGIKGPIVDVDDGDDGVRISLE
jgi:SHOCT-like domain